jgi:glycogen synthase
MPVHFMGKQERVNELLPLADLMVMPSELESFGLAALEAMACKVPSIATRVGGVPELIDDGVTGLLYPVGDVDGMAAGAVSLLKDRDRLEAMREAGRKTAQKRFCSSLVVPQYVQGRVKSQRPGALLGGEGGDGGQNTAQGYGYVAPVVHQANGFSGERHGFPRGELTSLL